MSPVAAPHLIARHGRFCAEAIAHFRRPRMSRDVRFALVREPLNPHALPQTKATLAALARAIHFERAGKPIVLEAAPLRVREWDEELQGVSVHTLGPDGEPDRYIGWAWLDGFDWRTLQRALDSQVSTAPTLGGRAA